MYKKNLKNILKEHFVSHYRIHIKRVFESMVVITFQNVFHSEIH